MANEKNLKLLANLIRKVAGTDEGKTDKETIDIAVKKLKTTQRFDPKLEKGLKRSGLMEEWNEYLSRKFMGAPTVKNWAYLNYAEKGIFKPIDNGVDEDEHDDTLAVNNDPLDFVTDSEEDTENGISNSDIDSFLDTIHPDEYISTVYEPDEFEDEPTEEFEDEEEDEFEDELDEALSRATRIKMKNRMKRLKGIISRKRKLALKRRATMDVLKKRARKLAIRMLKQKYAKKAVSDMSVAERERVETMLAKRKSLVDRLTIKMIPVVRKIENERFAHKQETK